MSGSKSSLCDSSGPCGRPLLAAAPRIPIKILAVCDSPTVLTGFARVARNILGRWRFYEEGEPVDCWAINFDGWGYDQVGYRLFPGGKHDWNSPGKLNQLLKLIADGQYTHLWMLMDPDALSVHGFPQKLRQVCKVKNVRVMLYFPVDAPPEWEWLSILDAVDVAVTYAEFGRNEIRKALGKSLYPIEVVPHGVDDCFKPLSVEDRAKARCIELILRALPGGETPPGEGNRTMKGTPRGDTRPTGGERAARSIHFVEEDTFLMLNVNKNEWRKDPLRSLEILAGLRKLGVPAKLILRMDPMSAMGGVHLDMAAQQLGLTYGKEWCHIGPVNDEAMAALYNAADLYLTTSLGEGWGLGVTEAMACHCPVAMPKHTSLAEIGEGSQVIWLPREEGFVCGADTRLRRRVCLAGAVEHIFQAYGLRCGHGVRVAPAAGAFKSWDWVAERLFELLVGAERSDIAGHSDVPVGGSPTGTGGSPVLPGEVLCAS